MPWSLREIANPWGNNPGEGEYDIGSCWRASPLNPESIRSPEWRASGRDYFIWIVLPSRDLFTPDRLSSNNTSGWTVTGELPTITVTPSIGSRSYHGFITDGVLGDDVEGRRYGQDH